MRKGIIRVVVILPIFVAAAFAGFIWRAHTDRRSIPGHVMRFFRGESGAEQQIDDLAEEIRNKTDLAPLQSWAIQTVEAFKEGKLHDTGEPPEFWFGEQPALKLSRKDRPDFITHEWGETNEDGEEEPEILVVMGTNRRPESIAIAWYQYGIQIGRTNYQMPYPSSEVSLYVKAKPGVYVYNNYK